MAETVNKDINGDECPMGDACPMHYRLSAHDEHPGLEMVRYVDYFEQYVVITGDNPELDSAYAMLSQILGTSTVIPKYETIVMEVGPEGTVFDKMVESAEAANAAVKFEQQHDDYSNARNAHDMVLASVKDRTLDLSETAPSYKF